jgi:hypothetical protein
VEETTYQAGNWPTARRLVYKAEVLAKGPNTRFVVTTHLEPLWAVSDANVDRGRAAKHLKDFTNALAAVRRRAP